MSVNWSLSVAFSKKQKNKKKYTYSFIDRLRQTNSHYTRLLNVGRDCFPALGMVISPYLLLAWWL